ncbi:MAG: hypothetical protein WB870_13350, partial [Gallionellaceae bacterium]
SCSSFILITMPRIMIDHGHLFRLKPRWIHAPPLRLKPHWTMLALVFENQVALQRQILQNPGVKLLPVVGCMYGP